jgi:hypothetical protein
VCNLQLRIKNLRRNIILKTIAGILVVCTFILSITPKQVLHSIAADHKDQSSKKINDRLQFNEVGFNCDCNSIVATSPFTEVSAKIGVPKLIHFSFYTESSSTSLSSSDHFDHTLRGPPAFI